MVHTEETTVAISGGGPAGITLGLLLARAGVDVTVLEKHGDFLRDFRGDTVHPSTLELLDELGLAEEMERLPHRKVTTVTVGNAEQPIVAADLGDLPGKYHYVAMTPQWDFLEMLTRHAARYPTFNLLMNSESTGLIEEDGAVRGLTYTTRAADGTDTGEQHRLRAVLTVSAEGRRSDLRGAAGMVPRDLGAPMDVVWLQVPRDPGTAEGFNGRLGAGAIGVAIDRGDFWQVGYVIPKGGLDEIRSQPISALQDRLLELLPFLGERVREVDDWQQVAFLEVGLNRLTRWHRTGLLCIGDAAHTMTPVGGVGINLAVQDAVAAANLLADPLFEAQQDPDRFGKTLNPELLERVQRRRQVPTVGTQAIQWLLQRQVISRALAEDPTPPPLLRLVAGTRAWSRLVGRVMMQGIRPEHVQTPERAPAFAEG